MAGASPPWPPPTVAPPGRPSAPGSPRPAGGDDAGYQAVPGRFVGADGGWHLSHWPPADGWRLGPDGIWRPTDAASHGPARGSPVAAPPSSWRSARWGLGDVWWGALVYLVGMFGASLVLVAAIAASGREVDELDGNGVVNAAFSVVAVVAFGVVPWIASRRKGSGRLRDDFGLWVRPVDVAIGIGIGFAGMIVAGIVGVALDTALGADEATTNLPTTDSMSAAEMVALFVAIAVITPVVEELFFRGLLLRSLLKRGSRALPAILVSNVVFVLPHLLAVPEWPGAASLFASVAVLGLAFHLAAFVTDWRLGAGIVAHAVVNGIALVGAFAT